MKVPFHFPPPTSWEDFEEMLCDLFRAEWNDPHTQKHGRKGQRQYGVDIFGQPGQKGVWTGVQAKEKDQLSASSLTEKELADEVEKAKNFDPPLTDFIIATTGPRDQNIQRKARLITQDHQKVGLFRVHVYSWEEIEKLLETHQHIRRQWYQERFSDDQSSSVKQVLFLGENAIAEDNEQINTLGIGEQRQELQKNAKSRRNKQTISRLS